MAVATRIRIYCDESDRAGHAPLTEAVVRLLRRERAAGVTVVMGVIGFGGSRALHSARNVELPSSRPCIVEWLDSPENVERIWPVLEPMVRHVVVTTETVELLVLPHHGLRRIPKDEQVREVMESAPVTVTPQTPLMEVVATVLKHGLRFVPVVEDGALAGVITNGDLVVRGGLTARLELIGAGARAASGVDPAQTAADVMTRDVVAAEPGMKLRDAAHLMVSRTLKRLPVVDGDGRLAGVISRADLLRSVADVYPEPDDEAVEHAGPTIGDAATRHVPIIPPAMPIAEVVDRVASTRLNLAVVLDADERPLGIVSDAELLRRIEGGHQGLLDLLMRRPGASVEETGKTAADVMDRAFLVLDASTPVADAVRRMMEGRRKLIVVVDEDGRLRGMVDRAGALRAVFPHSAERPV